MAYTVRQALAAYHGARALRAHLRERMLVALHCLAL